MTAAPPYRADGVNDMVGRQPVSGGDFRSSTFTAAKESAFLEQAIAGRPVNRTVDTATAEQGLVRGIDDRVDLDPGDVALDYGQARSGFHSGLEFIQ